MGTLVLLTFLGETRAVLAGSTLNIGKAECSGIRGESSHTRPIQMATLKTRAGGYTLQFRELIQGRVAETIWQLDKSLFIEKARTLGTGANAYDWNLVPYNRQEPVAINPTGKFKITMLVSSRSGCTFSGTLQFLGNAKATLFP
jgi:hypothetical protein